MLASVKRKIPCAESPSKVLFHSCHPSVRGKIVVIVVRVVLKSTISVRSVISV